VEAYTIKDIVFLMNILMICHRLTCTLHLVKQNKPYIYIKNKSMPLLLEGIRPFITSMQTNAAASFSGRRMYSKRSGDYSPSLCNPVLSYKNADVLKKAIVEENKGRIGIYR